MSNKSLLVRDLHVRYGAIAALRGCSIELNMGEVVAIVGANGAGKTTLLRAISSLIKPSSGQIEFDGKNAIEIPPHQLARDGLLHIPEGRGTLPTLSVEENLRIAFDIRPSSMVFALALNKVFNLFPRLCERRKQAAGSMSGGEQQMLALARAVVNPPRVLLLDEPSLGLSPVMVAEAYRVLKLLQNPDMAILVVEQNLHAALRFAQRAYVLRQGQVVHQGTSNALLADSKMMNHYMGAEC